MLNNYFIAQIAENIFISHWEKKPKQENWTAPLQVVKLKISLVFSFKPTPIFSDTEIKVVGKSFV